MTDLWWREEGAITVTQEHIVTEMRINNRSLSEGKGITEWLETCSHITGFNTRVSQSTSRA